MQESIGGLITTFLVSMKPTGFQNEMMSRHKEYKSDWGKNDLSTVT